MWFVMRAIPHPTAIRWYFPRAAAFSLALVSMIPSAFAAQWKWIDAQGVVHYSDQPPPPSVPARNILQRPQRPGGAQPVATPSTAASAHAATPAASSALEKKIAEKKAAEHAAQEQDKLRQQQELALQNQQNCLQAQRELQILDSGQRMVQIDAQGQRVVMDDAQRAAQRARISALIAQYCR